MRDIQNRTGLYRHLLEKTKSWHDRVKICRYIWKFSHVNLVNKHQVLLGWLAYALKESRRVPVEESLSIWQCFHDVLHSNFCRAAIKNTFYSNKSLTLKVNVAQRILEETKSFVNEADGHKHDGVSVDVVVACVQQIMLASGMRRIFTANSSILATLCAQLFEVLEVKLLTEDLNTAVISKLFDVLVLCLQEYVKSTQHTAKPGATFSQVCQKFLPQVIRALYISRVLDTTDDVTLQCSLSVWKEAIWLMIRDTLMRKFFKDDYEHLLKITGANAHRNILIDLFSVLQLGDRQVVAAFLPKFYDVYVGSECGKKSKSSGQMFLYLVKNCLRLDFGNNTNVVLDSENVLECVHDLLSLVTTRDTYKIVEDNASEDQPFLKWFNCLATDLLSMETRCGAWFSCLTCLLDLNPAILEPKLQTILTIILRTDTATVESLEKYQSFFNRLVLLYQKLAQIPKLVKRLVEVISKPEAEEHLEKPLPGAFADCLGEAVSKLLVTSQLTVWETVIGCLEDVVARTPQVASFTLAAELFCVIVKNLQVSDYNLPKQMSLRVSELMTQSWQRCCFPLVRACVESKVPSYKLESCLSCLLAWGDLTLLLRFYTTFTGAQFENQLEPQSTGSKSKEKTKAGLEYFSEPIFPEDSKAELKSLEKVMVKCHDSNVNWLQMKSIQQRMTATIINSGYNQGFQPTKTGKELLAYFLRTFELNDLASLNRQLIDQWQSFLDELAIYAPHINDDDIMESLATLLVKGVLAEYATGDLGECLTDFAKSCNTFMQGSVFLESRPLQACVLRAIVMSLGKFPKSAKFGNKERKALNAAFVRTIFNVSEPQTYFRKKEFTVLTSDAEYMWQHLQVLHVLPLEFLTKQHASTCFSAVFVTLHLIDPLLKRTTCDVGLVKLVETSLHLLQIIVKSQSGASNFISEEGMGDIFTKLYDTCRCLDNQLSTEAKKDYKYLIEEVLQNCNSSTLKTITEKVFKSGMHRKDTVAVETSQSILKAITMTRTMKPMRDACYKQLFLVHKKQFEAVLTESAKLTTGLIDAFGMLLRFEIGKGSSPKLQTLLCYISAVFEAALEMMKTQNIEELEPCFRFLTSLCDKNIPGQGLVKDSAPFLFETLTKLITKNIAKTVPNVEQNSISANQVLINLYQQFVDENAVESSTNQNKGHISSAANQIAERTEVDMDVSNEDTKVTVLSKEEKICTVQTILHENAIEKEVCNALASVLSVCTVEGVEQFLQQLATYIVAPTSLPQYGHVLASLRTVKSLMTKELTKEQWAVLAHFLQQTLMSLMRLVSEKTDILNTAVSVQVLHFLRFLTVDGSFLLTAPQITASLHACFATSLNHTQIADVNSVTSLSLDDYVTVFSAVYDVINALIVKHPRRLMLGVPQFVAAVKTLMVSIIHRGQQQTPPIDKEGLVKLVKCAHLVERLFDMIGKYPVEFSKIVVYIVADYVAEVQKVTLYPQVKRTLLSGLNYVLDVCDNFAISQLHVQLDVASREIFKDIYKDYKTYHKFTTSTEKATS